MKKRIKTINKKQIYIFAILLIIILFIASTFIISYFSKDEIIEQGLKNLGLLTEPEYEKLNRPGIGEIDLRENVLIIYNKNYVYGRELAEYYADKRGIDYSHLCEVSLPNGDFATKEHLLGARKTIYDDCLCRLAENYETCSEDNRKEVIRDSLITHFVIIKGIPHRLTGIGSSLDYEEPSFDYFLSLIDMHHNKMVMGVFPDNRGRIFYGYTRALDPNEDGIFSYGRIEEMNAERTKKLIDKTILSEQKGISGNFVLAGGSFISSFFKELSSSYKDPCNDHYEGGEWNYQECRLGVSSLQVPGEPSSEIKKVINAGIYLGNAHANNGHSAFDGFYNMLNWHKSEYDCITLCEDFTNPIDKQNCRDNSEDYFKEINTDCVGANNLIGWQLISYSVQYFGFWPTGWYPKMSGSSEKTPPIVLEGDSFKNEKFTDNKYLRFGSLDNEIVENPECILENGDIENCDEIVAVNLEKRYININNIAPGEKRSFTIKFRHRNPEYNNGKLYVRFLAWYKDKTYSSYGRGPGDIIISKASNDWTSKEIKIEIENNKDIDINNIWLRITSHKKSNIKKWFEIDAIELIDEKDSYDYVDEIGSFNKSFIGQTRSGDYASNAIARLGAIGWWGSGSHFYTWGFAFSDTHRFIGSFYSGKSLGESLLFAGNPMSGTIYADPLYRPSGVKIYLSDGTKEISRPNRYYFSKNLNFPNDDIYINAFHGKDGNSNWHLSYCIGDNPDFCDRDNNWIELESGEGLAYHQKINTNLDDIEFANENLTIILKLRVWRDGEENNDLTDFAYLNHLKDIECPEKYGLEFNGKINRYGGCFYDIIEEYFCKNHTDCNEEEFCYFAKRGYEWGICEKFNARWTKDITNCRELQLIDKNLNEDYQLIRDINCSESKNWFNGTGFIPIGDKEPFKGSLNGNGYSIKNLFINKSSMDGVGLISGGNAFKIKNLNIIDAYIKGRRFVGGFVGLALNSSEINNCSFIGKIDSVSNTGGLIGIGGDIKINRCSVELESIKDKTSNIGGFIGWVLENINIENSISKVKSKDSINTGGFIGHSQDNTTINILIKNSYSIVDLQEVSYSGGIIGRGKGRLENVFSISNISKSTESGNLIGKAYDSTEIINSYYFDFNSNNCIGENSDNENIDCNNILDRTYFYEKTNEPLSKWNFENIWNASSDNYPDLIRIIEDSDGDSIPNEVDKCQNTSLELKENVNKYGCPKPTSKKFDIPSNLDTLRLRNYSNFEIRVNNTGKIIFKENINLIKRINGTFISLDLDSNINISHRRIFLNSTELPELNKSAEILIKNISFINPIILKNNQSCEDCLIIFYNNTSKEILFNVRGFTIYEVIEGCGDGNCDSDKGETCSTCPEDCNVCETKGGNNGRGGGRSSSKKIPNKTPEGLRYSANFSNDPVLNLSTNLSSEPQFKEPQKTSLKKILANKIKELEKSGLLIYIISPIILIIVVYFFIRYRKRMNKSKNRYKRKIKNKTKNNKIISR